MGDVRNPANNYEPHGDRPLFAATGGSSMSSTLNSVRGVIHGKTIELAQEPGLAKGQEVIVTLKPVEPNELRLPPGEGLRRAFGGWAEDADELDKFLEEARRARKRNRPELGDALHSSLPTDHSSEPR